MQDRAGPTAHSLVTNIAGVAAGLPAHVAALQRKVGNAATNAIIERDRDADASVQRDEHAHAGVDGSSVHRMISQTGRSLPPGLRSGLEAKSGSGLGAVQVDTGPESTSKPVIDVQRKIGYEYEIGAVEPTLTTVLPCAMKKDTVFATLRHEAQGLQDSDDYRPKQSIELTADWSTTHDRPDLEIKLSELNETPQAHELLSTETVPITLDLLKAFAGAASDNIDPMATTTPDKVSTITPDKVSKILREIVGKYKGKGWEMFAGPGGDFGLRLHGDKPFRGGVLQATAGLDYQALNIIRRASLADEISELMREHPGYVPDDFSLSRIKDIEEFQYLRADPEVAASVAQIVEHGLVEKIPRLEAAGWKLVSFLDLVMTIPFKFRTYGKIKYFKLAAGKVMARTDHAAILRTILSDPEREALKEKAQDWAILLTKGVQAAIKLKTKQEPAGLTTETVDPNDKSCPITIYDWFKGLAENRDILAEHFKKHSTSSYPGHYGSRYDPQWHGVVTQNNKRVAVHGHGDRPIYEFRNIQAPRELFEDRVLGIWDYVNAAHLVAGLTLPAPVAGVTARRRIEEREDPELAMIVATYRRQSARPRRDATPVRRRQSRLDPRQLTTRTRR